MARAFVVMYFSSPQYFKIILMFKVWVLNYYIPAYNIQLACDPDGTEDSNG